MLHEAEIVREALWWGSYPHSIGYPQSLCWPLRHKADSLLMEVKLAYGPQHVWPNAKDQLI